MQTTTLGRTNLIVSRMGMGAGGLSRLGKRTGNTESECVEILRQAFDCGVNFVDTSDTGCTEQRYVELHSVFKILIYQEVMNEATPANPAENRRVTHRAIIDFIAFTRPYETFHPFVRFTRMVSGCTMLDTSSYAGVLDVVPISVVYGIFREFFHRPFRRF